MSDTKEPAPSSTDEAPELEDWHLDFMSKIILDYALEACQTLAEAHNALEELKQPSTFQSTIDELKDRGDVLAELINTHKVAQNWYPESIDRQICYLKKFSQFVEAKRKTIYE